MIEACCALKSSIRESWWAQQTLRGQWDPSPLCVASYASKVKDEERGPSTPALAKAASHNKTTDFSSMSTGEKLFFGLYII
jgi:hypothetical protein